MTTLENLDPMIRGVASVPSLCLDGSGLRDFHMCPRRAFYKLILRRASAVEDHALVFGKVMHIGWDWRYRVCGSRGITEAEEEQQMAVIDAAYARLEPPCDAEDGPLAGVLDEMDEKRAYLHPGRAKDVMRLYNAHYGAEPFKVVATERHFEMRLGYVNVMRTEKGVYPPLYQRLPLVWEGRYDMVVETPEGEWVVDHKTTSKWGGAFESDPWREWRVHSSCLGYCWHRWRETSRLPLGYVIRVAVVRPPLQRVTAKSPPRNQFEEHSFPVKEAQLIEWERNVLSTVRGWVRYAEDEWWPMHDKAGYNCKFCEFQQVCAAPDEPSRAVLLDSSSYKVNDWHPGEARME